MAYNKSKLAELIFKNTEGLPERCPEYRETVRDILCSILDIEQMKRIHGIRTKSKVEAECVTLGNFLLKKADSSS